MTEKNVFMPKPLITILGGLIGLILVGIFHLMSEAVWVGIVSVLIGIVYLNYLFVEDQ